jgi:hypothetical protein
LSTGYPPKSDSVMTRAALIAAAFVAVTVTACGQSPGSDNGDRPPSRSPLPIEVVSRYGPRLYFHPSEKFWPYDPSSFISHSSLWWAHKGSCRDHLVANLDTVDASRLGAGSQDPYTDSPRDPRAFHCRSQPKFSFRASSHTRPYDGDRPYPLNRLGHEGFNLNLDDAFRGGFKDASPQDHTYTSPAPLEYEDGKLPDGYFTTYWFFHAFNGTAVSHEGDWERISVRLASDRTPLETAYYRHGGPPRFLSWGETPKYQGVHPNVYVGLGSHASYESPRLRFRDRTSSHGQVWSTWEGKRKIDVAREPWFSYGGAWGRVGHAKDTTGPTGPGEKKAYPDAWDKPSPGPAGGAQP